MDAFHNYRRRQCKLLHLPSGGRWDGRGLEGGAPRAVVWLGTEERIDLSLRAKGQRVTGVLMDRENRSRKTESLMSS